MTDFDGMLEDMQLDYDMAVELEKDRIYLQSHPDPYAGVDFRESFFRCPTCHLLMPYQGCALHEHGVPGDHFELYLDAPETLQEKSMATTWIAYRRDRENKKFWDNYLVEFETLKSKRTQRGD